MGPNGLLVTVGMATVGCCAAASNRTVEVNPNQENPPSRRITINNLTLYCCIIAPKTIIKIPDEILGYHVYGDYNLN
jgi:hypothetical protein